MSTMFPNGALMQALLTHPTPAPGAAPSPVVQQYGEDLFHGINYRTMVDDAQNTARAMGVEPGWSGSERLWFALLLVAVAAAIVRKMQRASKNEREEAP